MADWRSVYEQYVGLAPRWRAALRKYAADDVNADEALSEFITKPIQPVFDIPDPPPPADIEAAVQLRELWQVGEAQFYATTRDPSEYEDVYHVALALRLYQPHTVFRFHFPGMYYRGQRRDRWRTVPSLFRLGPEEASHAVESVTRQTALLAAFTDALESTRPGQYSDEQRVAIAQHYGQQSAAHPPLCTWLLDLTTDPLIALFFASCDGQEGDCGVIMRVSAKEWERLSANGQNTFGPLRVVEVPGAERIERQHGLFLQAPHPDLIDQYGGAQMTFHQKPGLAFEDATLGITKSRLLPGPHADPLADWVQQWHPPTALPQREWPVLATYHQGHLSSQDYHHIIQSWLPHWNVSSTAPELAAHRVVLQQLTKFHARIQTFADQIEPAARSIHNLESAARSLVYHDEASLGFPMDLQRVVRWEYLSKASDSTRPLLENILQECERT